MKYSTKKSNKSASKKAKRFFWGGVYLDPKPSEENPQQDANQKPVTPTNAAPIQLNAPDFSQLQMPAYVPTSNDGTYNSMKKQYGAAITGDAAAGAGALRTAGSMFGPIGTGLAAMGGFAINALAQNKAYRLQNTTVGWSPGQSQDAEAWFRNYATGGVLTAPAMPKRALPKTKRSRSKFNPTDLALPIALGAAGVGAMLLGGKNAEQNAAIDAAAAPLEGALNNMPNLVPPSNYAPPQGYVPQQQTYLPDSPDITMNYYRDNIDQRTRDTYLAQDGPGFSANTGGDLRLSDNSFQVKGNPNVTDGNTYMFNNQMIKLDNNEVVKDSFVYSDNLMAMGKQTFAEVAKNIEKSTGKAQEKAKAFGDKDALNTIKWNEQNAQQLRQSQEAIAMMQGHRNPDGSTKQPGQYDKGGPLPWQGFDVAMFQNLYNTYLRDVGLDASNYIKEDGAWGTQTSKAFADYGPQIVNDWSHMFGKQYDTKTGALSDYRYIPESDRIQYEMMTRDRTPLDTLPTRFNGQNYRRYTTPNMPAGGFGLAMVGPDGKPFTNPADAQAATARPETTAALASLKAGANAAINPVTGKPPVTDRDYQTPFTVGDALQAIEVGQKFWALKDGPEREKAYMDLTPISKASYDVRSQLYQNQRNLRNQMGSLDTSNINLRRSLYNQTYANKLNADSQALNQYQQLNNQAQIQYEDRLSNQKRYNIGQKVYTDDINARNRGQYNTLVDNAWTSLGNFGEQLNKKVYANDALRLYKEIYPKTADRALEALSKEDLLKLLRLGNYGSK